MTHIYEVSESEMVQLSDGSKKFDVLQFRRPVSIMDTVIYQLEHQESVEESETTSDEKPTVPQEYIAKINFIFSDTEGALKKGFTAVGFE